MDKIVIPEGTVLRDELRAAGYNVDYNGTVHVDVYDEELGMTQELTFKVVRFNHPTSITPTTTTQDQDQERCYYGAYYTCMYEHTIYAYMGEAIEDFPKFIPTLYYLVKEHLKALHDIDKALRFIHMLNEFTGPHQEA